MSQTFPDFFDTDGRPVPPAGPEAERKLKVWAVLSAVSQGLMSADEACAAYGISAPELEHHRAGWLEFGAGGR